MKIFVLCLLMILPGQTRADGYVLGAGRWTCENVIKVYETGSASEKGQLAGWMLGFWSAATLQREKKFIDAVEKAGGRGILEFSVKQCRSAPPETLLFRITQQMIRNTG